MLNRLKATLSRGISRLCGHPVLKMMFLLGLVFLVLPFGVYFFERLTGILPSEAEWHRDGMYGPNHGPWHIQLEGFLILYPYLFLIPLTVVTGVFLAAWKRRPFLLLNSFTICFFMVLMAGLQIYYFWFVEGWVVD